MPPVSEGRAEVTLWVLERFLGEPYVWGGDDPEGGFDCSGLVIEGLKSSGVLPRAGDWTAEMLYQRWRHTGVLGEARRSELRPGHLLFWGGETKTHVEMVWALVHGVPLTIGASGGGSKTLTKADAIAQNAYVKIRPAVPGWVAVWPF